MEHCQQDSDYSSSHFESLQETNPGRPGFGGIFVRKISVYNTPNGIKKLIYFEFLVQKSNVYISGYKLLKYKVVQHYEDSASILTDINFFIF